MQAIVLAELGGLDSIRPGEVTTPVAAPGEVLIRVATVAVNRQDLNLIFGRFSVPGFELPHVLGLDPAGAVAGLGEGVDDLVVGDRVIAKPPIGCAECPACERGEDDACERIRSIGIHRPGGMAEFVSVPRRNVFTIPPGVSMATATAFSHSFPVALTLLRKIGITSSDEVLVSGASGAVGSAVVQLARSFGATVIGAVSTTAGRDWLQALPGAIAPDAVVDLAATPAFAAGVRERSPGGVSVYVETASDPDVWSEALKAVGRGARIAVVGAHAGPRVEVDNNWLFRQRVSIIGCSGSSVSAYAEALALLGRAAIRPHIDSIVPMSEAAAAYGRLRSRENQGKIVLRVADDIE